MSGDKCPVCNSEMKQPKSVNVEGKNINVCGDACATKVKQNPARYAAAGSGGQRSGFGASGSTVGSGAGSSHAYGSKTPNKH